MKKHTQNFCLLIIASFVLLVSMGINVSKMACDVDSNIYLGIKEFSCTLDQQSSCSINEKSCCSLKIEKKCCPEEPDNNCKTNSSLIQFDFETVVKSLYNYDYFYNYTSCLFFNFFRAQSNYIYKIYRETKFLLVAINKPQLSTLQMFLI